ncbi:MAG TPA: hypothetical protein VLF64_00955 [Candidatus Saccharimonadales bacterium]|nr:hypothetical protein [Candidatus Saccharimonadales bacterium]
MNDQPQTPTSTMQDKPEGVIGPSATEGLTPTPSITGQQSPIPNLSPNKSKKTRTVLFVIVGGLLVLGIAVAVVYFAFFYVSKADYKSAEKQTNTAIAAYHKADDVAEEWSTAAVDTSATDRDIATKKAAYNDANTAYKTTISSLSGMRALKDDKVKSAYDAFVTKNNAAMVNNDSMAEAMPTLRTMVVECNNADTTGMDTSDLSTIADSWDRAFTKCTKAIKELSSARNVDVATIGKKLEQYFTEMRTDIVALQVAYIAKDETAFTKAYNAFTDVEDKYNADASLKNVKKHQDSLLPETELNNLLAAIRSRE